MKHTLARRGTAAVSALLLAAGAAACGEDAPGDASSPATEGATAPASEPVADETIDAGFPVTVRSCGQDYTFEAPPERVVVGTPTSVDTLAALGVADAAVGYISGDFGPAPESADVPEISPDYQAPSEIVLAAEPDLFVGEGLQINGEEGTVSVDDLRQAGANAYVLGEYCVDAPGADDVAAVYTDIENLGAIFGVAEDADALVAELEERVAAAADRRGDSPPPRVAYVDIFDGVLYALSGTGYAATLDALGAVNVFADIEENFAEISPEAVLALDADAVVFAYDPGGDEVAARAEVEELLAATAAVQSGTVVGVPRHLPGFGVSVVENIEIVAEGLYGP